MTSYPFPEIELELKSDLESQVDDFILLFDSIMTSVSLLDFFSIPESTLNPVPVHCEIESPISYDHTMGKVCEHQFFGLDPIFEIISTLIVDSRIDLSQFPESVSVFFLFHLSPNPSFSNITLHCWTRMLTKMTQ